MSLHVDNVFEVRLHLLLMQLAETKAAQKLAVNVIAWFIRYDHFLRFWNHGPTQVVTNVLGLGNEITEVRESITRMCSEE